MSSEEKFDEPVKESILPAGIGDQPAKTDELGFEPYVQAIVDFLTHTDTRPPLTLSIEGQWGSGKSSFMYQLEDKLKKKKELTVIFNAWRYDKEDALWATFALDFIHQISQQHSFLHRWLGHFKLLYYRFSWKNGWLDAIRALTIWIFIISLISTALILIYLKGFYWVNSFSNNLIEFIGQNNNEPLQAVINYFIGLGGIAGITGIIVSLGIKLKNFVGNPLDIDLNKYIQSPDYEDRIGFIENFHKDFNKIVNAYAGKNKVYVFIDDLDRCEVPKASDLMQAINLMISSDPRLIFIIGMDREKIAASFAVKHKEVLPYLFSSRFTEVAVKTSTEISSGIEYGYAFLEKFIQLPFLVPQPDKSGLQRFLVNISIPVNKSEEKKSESSGKAQIQHYQQNLTEEQKTRRESIRIAVTGDSQTIRDIVLMVALALDNNPRRLKQFINLFRLKTFIANETGLFDFLDGESSGECLTLEQLGKFVAISLKWPLLIADLDINRKLLAELQKIALDNEKLSSDKNMQSKEAVYWSHHQKLMDLLKEDGSNNNDSSNIIFMKKQKCNLSKLNLDKLLQISPRVVRLPLISIPEEKLEDEKTIPDKKTNERIPDLMAEILGDEEMIEQHLIKRGGQAFQSEIVKESGLSKSKISILLAKMKDEGRIIKIRKGKDTIIRPGIKK